MTYEDGLLYAIIVVSIIGTILGTYVTMKIYSKEGFR